ncbi:Potassium channel AKT2 [Seminavis robusta]|uniref:Potassium channel AKT2 n=1 Tax=Seminavis robusta TaxID=568900 RepID=A0A9N8EHK2_9STRA|nr:Potassium channel AKT2 [Seminavis robusta]|eukprot:Sro1109_g242290.1 Potassium channel AKT2 (884) ;mRNA; f:16748-19526
MDPTQSSTVPSEEANSTENMMMTGAFATPEATATTTAGISSPAAGTTDVETTQVGTNGNSVNQSSAVTMSTGSNKGVTWGGHSVGKPASSDNDSKMNRRQQLAQMSDVSFKRQKVEQQVTNHVFLPWTPSYRYWWGFSCFWSVMTIFFETFQIAFSPAGMPPPHNDAASVLEFLFMAIFTVDILVHFNLAFYNDHDEMITDRRLIARNYFKLMFWVDLIGVFPFYYVALAITGEMGQDSDLARYLSILRLFRLVRLHRIKQLFDALQYNTHVSLTALTLTRNFGAAMVWTHFAACVMYFIARQYNFENEETWIGGQVNESTGYERYVTALYWSVVTFTTVGYGDFSPVNPAEQIFGMIYMLINMVIAAWMIGSITLLIVKKDEVTSEYRDTLLTLDNYAKIHDFDRRFRKRLRTQAKLYFNNRQIADEEVLQNLPLSVRRKVLRKLYLPSLLQTSLMKGIRQQFVDAFLTNCTVEIFSAGEEILSRGCASNDLYLLVDGKVKLLDAFSRDQQEHDNRRRRRDSMGDETSFFETTSVGDSEGFKEGYSDVRILGPGHFINDISFFTETPNTDTSRTKTVCKTLTLSQSAYKMIADDHPGSIGKILSNLLHKVEEMAEEVGDTDMCLTKRMEVLKAGSVFDMNASRAFADASERSDSDPLDMHKAVATIQAQSAVVACKDVIKMHIDKMKDDHTTRFLFAASRNSTATITLMCDQGFDPNSADYDHRTALMVASMKGNIEAVKKLLEYQADPNLADMHGTTALHEAAKNGHEETMALLMEHGAELCMSEYESASVMCQTVFDGDTVKLRRLLTAKVNVDAGDYDKRTAVHIAAAEGNLVALKVLVEFGADLTVRDRWNNTAMDEAKSVKAQHVLDFLETALAEGN